MSYNKVHRTIRITSLSDGVTNSWKNWQKWKNNFETVLSSFVSVSFRSADSLGFLFLVYDKCATAEIKHRFVSVFLSVLFNCADTIRWLSHLSYTTASDRDNALNVLISLLTKHWLPTQDAKYRMFVYLTCSCSVVRDGRVTSPP